jgi:cytochrome c553
MPSLDFTEFSDQEISDIAAYARSLPPVDRVMPPSELGPVYTLLIYKGDIPISAERIDHAAKRPTYPPPLRVSLDLGQHLASTCRGCHGPSLNGGPIQGGDPSWPPARNLTFHTSGLEGWSLAEFTKALREGVRPDGKKVDPVMPIPYTARLQDTEIGALYIYLKSLPPKKYAEK